MPVFGTSETSVQTSSEMEIIFEMQTNSGTETSFGMETIDYVGIGINMFSHSAPGIGIAIGTTTAITGGTVTAAVSLMEHG